MVAIPLGLGDWESESQNSPRFRLHNMYVTENPISHDGYSRVSRPTLKEFTTVGTGPINGFWRQASTFDGDFFVVSGEELYRVTLLGDATLLGSIPGTGFCEFSGQAGRVLVLRDGIVYSTDGATVTTVVIPDDSLISSIATINSYFIFSVKDSQVFYWTEPGQTDPDALSFASAERIPDDIIAVRVISDEVWFLGETGPEVWTPTGDADAPFQRVSGRVYAEGCVSNHTVVNTTVKGIPGLIWVTDTASVVISQGAPQKISNEHVEELLRKDPDNLRAWYFRHNRHDFYVLTSNTFTSVYDLDMGIWQTWDTYQKPNWLAHLGAQVNETVFAGSSEDNTLWELEEGFDDNGLTVVREVSGFVGHTDREIRCASVVANVNAGWSPNYTLEPILELRWSDDLGNTWSNYVPLSLGNRGVYRQAAEYRSLGLIQAPGRTFEFRFTHPARIRIDYATMNEKLNGS